MLDLCCGKGGDLLKWKEGNISYLVGAGMSETVTHSQLVVIVIIMPIASLLFHYIIYSSCLSLHRYCGHIH